LTANDLADRLDVNREVVRMYLRGERAGFGVLLAIADELDLSLDEYRRLGTVVDAAMGANA
jgi:transcriptional regulator with XRE-family HTH domain